MKSGKMAPSNVRPARHLKDKTMRCYFINKNDSPYFESDLFKNILAYLQTGTNKAKLKQAGKNFLLVVDDIRGMDEMLRFLTLMKKAVVKEEVVVEEV